MILALRTDKPEAELYLYEGTKPVDSVSWMAHRELSDTLLIKIEELLDKNSMTLDRLTGVAVYQGPGSFTGLRIGIATANTLAYALSIPIAGADWDNWLESALQKLGAAQKEPTNIVVPLYGSEPNITSPRK